MKTYLRLSIPIIHNLYRNFNENVMLEETLQEIKEAIQKTNDKKVIANLKNWEKQYTLKIKLPKELREVVTVGGIITKEKALKDYIYKNGLHYNDLEITKFIAEKYLGIGSIDLFGEDKYIVELKKRADSGVIGQVLAYYQYLKEKHNREFSIIIIAHFFSDNYRFAFEVVKNMKIDIRTLTYRFCEEGIQFMEIFN